MGECDYLGAPCQCLVSLILDVWFVWDCLWPIVLLLWVFVMVILRSFRALFRST